MLNGTNASITANGDFISEEELAAVRYIVQKILIPIVFAIGLIGNSITVLVLTRKPMRCSTNVYLTALAITDIFYLTMAFLLTLTHYDSFHTYSHRLYWDFYGLIVWLNDGFSYVSIYIIVSFTIERFIAVRYPIRRQTFCTETLAKKVIAGLVFFCLITTISTAFEYKVGIKSNTISESNTFICNRKEVVDILVAEAHKNNINSKLKLKDEISQDSQDIIISVSHPENTGRFLPTKERLEDKQINPPCTLYYFNDKSELGNNELYANIFFIYTMIAFIIVPLCILITFNSFLVILVRQSKQKRSIMTNLRIRSTKNNQKFSTSTKVSQENKITVVLIAVVIVFIICQLPWSIFMIVSNYQDLPRNLQLVCGNIFNLLVDVNAAINFFLYCVMSDKYRKTVKDLIMGYKHQRQDTYTMSRLTRQSTLTSSWGSNQSSRRYKNPLLNQHSKSKENNNSIPCTSSSSLSSLNKTPTPTPNTPPQFQTINSKLGQLKRNVSFFNDQESQSCLPVLNENQILDSAFEIPKFIVAESKIKHSKNCPHRKMTQSVKYSTEKRKIFAKRDNWLNLSFPNSSIKSTGKIQQTQRSQSLTSLAKTKHSPCCRDFDL